MKNFNIAPDENKAVVLLSGGLDSCVSLAAAKKYLDVKLALTFDYGQRAVEDEINSSRKIAELYGIDFKVIKLPFLSEISNSALNSENKNLEFETLNADTARAVWVPNRNGLFLNIAASFCDSFGYSYIIFGANKEEAGTFPDNSLEFTEAACKFFEYSTFVKPKIFAPLAGYYKYEIINLAIELGVDLKFLKSCYNSSDSLKGSHCGSCESCIRLKNAILKSKNKDLIKLFF